MKKIILVICLLFSGCSINQQFRQAVDQNWKTIRPEYVNYVNEDVNLTNLEKEIRIITVKLFDNLLKEANNGS